MNIVRSWHVSSCVAVVAIGLLTASDLQAQQENPTTVPAAQTRTRVVNNHWIEINSDGVSPEAGNFENDLKNLFDEVRNRQPSRIIVFVHGGLVTLKEANDRASKLTQKIMSEDRGTYPIFLNWEAGFVPSYFWHVVYERNGVSYRGTPGQTGAIASSPLVFVADIGRGATRLPINTVLSFAKASQNGDWLYKA